MESFIFVRFSEWPDDALESVSMRFLNEVDLPLQVVKGVVCFFLRTISYIRMLSILHFARNS